ncbi:MAG: helix-turn-helix transcriptional regulator [Bacteroidaceae bacterium]|nr:helix-turn-helix transcriptional regulator [Bacteroidaceae bacterium]
MKKTEEFCPIREILSKLGDKWSMLVLHYLNESSALRFSELQKAIPDVSQKMLTQTLRKLEGMHLIERTVYPEVPPRVEYRMTELGRSFMEKLNPLIRWASEFAVHVK